MDAISLACGLVAVLTGSCISRAFGKTYRGELESARNSLNQCVVAGRDQNGINDLNLRNDPEGALAALAMRGSAGEEAQRNLHLEYHARGLAQSKISFNLSLTFASLGFLVIALAVGLAVTGRPVGAGVTVAAGVITQAVGALFFIQASRARSLLQALFDALRVDRKNEREFLTALALIRAVDDSRVRNYLRGSVALHLIDPDVSTSRMMTQLRTSVNADVPSTTQSLSIDELAGITGMSDVVNLTNSERSAFRTDSAHNG